jgi:DNA invertase Pin-like site-specific DNA recombinase
MKIDYACVSTTDQNPTLQRAVLKKAGCDKIFTDAVSGALCQRSELGKCLTNLNADDVLMMWKLDWLGWSLHDFIHLLVDLKGPGDRCQFL